MYTEFDIRNEFEHRSSLAMRAAEEARLVRVALEHNPTWSRRVAVRVANALTGRKPRDGSLRAGATSVNGSYRHAG